MPTDHKSAVRSLLAAHDHLVDVAGKLSDEQVSGPSYCSEWNVAQALSHIGSGAEISLLTLKAALSNKAAPDRELYPPIWDRWNALSDSEKASAAITSDTAFAEVLGKADEDALSQIHIEVFGRELDATGLIGMRLGELVLHTWDVEVAGDKDTKLVGDAVAVLVDRMPAVATRLARGEMPSAKARLSVTTSDPERHFVLDLSGEAPDLAVDSEALDASLTIAAESFVRLINGRLDNEHTPSSVAIEGPVTLEDLRTLYPGF